MTFINSRLLDKQDNDGTFRQGLDETSKEALKVRLCWVVRMVRGLLGRLLSRSSDLTRLPVTLPHSSSTSSSSSSSLWPSGQTWLKEKCLFTYKAFTWRDRFGKKRITHDTNLLIWCWDVLQFFICSFCFFFYFPDSHFNLWLSLFPRVLFNSP